MATTRPATQDSQEASPDLFAPMLELASQLGAQLSPTPSNPDILRGMCPFHDPTTVNNANTLQINTRNARFWCLICGAEGNPLAFISRAWAVSARDAYTLLTTNPTPTPERPPYPHDHFNQASNGNAPQPQNTALLTRAAAFYANQLRTAYEPLNYLAHLGVHPDRAIQCGIGYSPGQGLREYLLSKGIDQTELFQSPLFNPTLTIESFAGRIILCDQDFTSATIWLTTMTPETPDPGKPWPTLRPALRGIQGLKPYLFNLYSISPKYPNGVLTDDPRLYIILKANNTPCALITQRARASLNLGDHCGRIAQSLNNRGLKQLIVALQDTRISSTLHERIRTIAPHIAVYHQSHNAIISAISIHTRDLSAFTNVKSLPTEPANNVQEPEQHDASPIEQAQPAQTDPSPQQPEHLDQHPQPPADTHKETPADGVTNAQS